jgi:hypothetical protein
MRHTYLTGCSSYGSRSLNGWSYPLVRPEFARSLHRTLHVLRHLDCLSRWCSLCWSKASFAHA